MAWIEPGNEQGYANEDAVSYLRALATDIEDGLFDTQNVRVLSSRDKMAWSSIYYPGCEYMRIEVLGKVHFPAAQRGPVRQEGEDE